MRVMSGLSPVGSTIINLCISRFGVDWAKPSLG